MIEHGRDMFPTPQTVSQFSEIDRLLVNPVIDAPFTARDKAALDAKRQFHRLGQIAVLMIAGSAIFTVADALLPNFVPDSFVLRLIVVSVAGIGILLQLYLIATGQKQKWLLNRYAAERLRSIKFQAYKLAGSVETADALPAALDTFFKRSIAALENELNGGIAVLRTFNAAHALIDVAAPKKPANSALNEAALEAYTELRMQYQSRFAQSEIERFTSRRRLFNSTQDMVYLAAAFFTFLALGAKLIEPFGPNIATGGMEFLAVSFFIIGATEAILDHALLEEQSQSRYEQYARDIDALIQNSKNRRRALPDLVDDMESLSLEELGHFCSAAQKISYRF